MCYQTELKTARVHFLHASKRVHSSYLWISRIYHSHSHLYSANGNHSPVFKGLTISSSQSSESAELKCLPSCPLERHLSALIFRKLCLERHFLSTEAGSLTLSFALSTLNNKDSRVLLQSLKNQPSLGPLHNSLLVFFTPKKIPQTGE